MKRIISYGAIVVSSYCVFLLASFPANRAYDIAKEMMPGVVLYDVTGTVWSGQANALVVNGKALREFEWTLTVLPLFLGRLAADVKFDNNLTWANATVGLNLAGNIVVSKLTGQLPAAELQTMLAKMPARLDGIFRVTMDKVVYSPEQKNLLVAEGHIDWQAAAITVLQEAKIGDFQVDLTTTDGGVNAVFSDVGDGPLMAEGEVTLNPEKQYNLQAKLKVRDTARQDLVQSLRFMGPMDAQGQVAVNKTGQL